MQVCKLETDRALGNQTRRARALTTLSEDANVYFQHDIQMCHLDPSLKAIFERSIAGKIWLAFVWALLILVLLLSSSFLLSFFRSFCFSSCFLLENDCALTAENVVGLEVLLRVGTDDRTVPAWHTRRYGRVLREVGAAVTLSEIAGKDHWWWDTLEANDGGVLFDPPVRTFMQRHLAAPRAPPVHPFSVLSLNPAVFESKHGLRILQLVVPFRLARLRVTPGTPWSIRAHNVHRFSLVSSLCVCGGGGGGGSVRPG